MAIGERAKATANIAGGRVKRVVGELGARPDLVLDGERQETEGLREAKAGRRRATGPKP